jgi:hypothetical protein
MSNEAMDELDWLLGFLPADGVPHYDLNFDDAAYLANQASHDAEETARAAFMQEQAQNSYSPMRSTNPGTNNVLHLSQVYTPASDGHHGGSHRQQTSSVQNQQFASPYPGTSLNQQNGARRVNSRPNPSGSSQYNSAAQEHQDAYRQSVSDMAPIGPPRRHFGTTMDLSEAGQGSFRTSEATRASAPAQRSISTMARASEMSQVHHRKSSAIPYQQYQRSSAQPPTAHRGPGPMAQVQGTHIPAARLHASQAPHGHITNPTHNAQIQPHSTAMQGNRQIPRVQGSHTPAARTQAWQGPYQSQSTSRTQSTQQSMLPFIAQRNWSATPLGRRPTQLAQSQTSQNPHQSQSTSFVSNTQQLSQSTAERGSRPMPPAQSAHTSVARTGESQGPYQSHFATPTQTVQTSSHPHAPSSSRTSIDAGSNARLASPKGCEHFAVRSTLNTRHPANPATGIPKISMQNSTGNIARSERTSAGSPVQDSGRIQSAEPGRVSSQENPQLALIPSPSLSSVSPVPVTTSVTLGPLAPTTVVPHQLEKGWPVGKEGSQGKSTPESSYRAPEQTSQQLSISRPNKESIPAGSSTSASNPPHAASHPRPSYTSPHATGPMRATFSDQGQTNSGNPQSRTYPLPRPLHHQTKRCAPDQVHAGSYMPPAKLRRMYNVLGQPVTFPTAASTRVPGSSTPVSQLYEEPSYGIRRGPGKILKNREDLVQPLSPSDALPKKSYDPATIARDVLIAAGKHPTEKPLNHHLEALRRNLTRIPLNADLSTFRWDVVDAVREPQKATHMPPAPAAPSPPPILTQSHPRDLQHTQNHVMAHTPSTSQHVPSRDTPPSHQVAPSTPIRIDARAPLGGLSVWGTLPFKPPSCHSSQRVSPSNLPSGLPRVDPVSASPKLSTLVLPTPPPPASPKLSTLVLPTPPPPASPKLSTIVLPTPPPPQPEQHRHETAKSAAPPDLPRPIIEVTPKSTTKSRPQGQTNKSQSDSCEGARLPDTKRLPKPQVVIPRSPVKMPSRRQPGRPPKSAAKNIKVAIHSEPSVRYQVFPCRWEGCTAELHNIDSVRAHVIKVHIPHSLVCKWTDCGNKTPMAAADMYTHVANEHISKMAWQLGDGPTVPVPGENITSSAHHASPRS